MTMQPLRPRSKPCVPGLGDSRVSRSALLLDHLDSCCYNSLPQACACTASCTVVFTVLGVEEVGDCLWYGHETAAVVQ